MFFFYVHLQYLEQQSSGLTGQPNLSLQPLDTKSYESKKQLPKFIEPISKSRTSNSF